MSARFMFYNTFSKIRSSRRNLENPWSGAEIMLTRQLEETSCHTSWCPRCSRNITNNYRGYRKLRHEPTRKVTVHINSQPPWCQFERHLPKKSFKFLDDVVIESTFPQKMKLFLPAIINRSKQFLMMVSKSFPTRSFVLLLAAVTVFQVQNFYESKLVLLPLNRRPAFMTLTDEEAMECSNKLLDKVKNLGIITTVLDADNNPIDEPSQQVHRVVHQLASANPELDQLLTPGAQWKVAVVDRSRDIHHNTACSFLDGTLVLAADVIAEMSEAGLAFMVSREMVHVVMRHQQEDLSNTIFFLHLFLGMLEPMAVVLPDFFVDLAVDAIAQIFKIYFPSDKIRQEKEADQFGFEMACKACYNHSEFSAALRMMDEWRQKATEASPQRAQMTVSEMMEEGDIMPGTSDQVVQWGVEKEEDWKKRHLSALITTDFWSPGHCEPVAIRVKRIESFAYQQNAGRWRRDKRCDDETLDDSLAATGILSAISDTYKVGRGIPSGKHSTPSEQD